MDRRRPRGVAEKQRCSPCGAPTALAFHLLVSATRAFTLTPLHRRGRVGLGIRSLPSGVRGGLPGEAKRFDAVARVAKAYFAKVLSGSRPLRPPRDCVKHFDRAHLGHLGLCPAVLSERLTARSGLLRDRIPGAAS